MRHLLNKTEALIRDDVRSLEATLAKCARRETFTHNADFHEASEKETSGLVSSC